MRSQIAIGLALIAALTTLEAQPARRSATSLSPPPPLAAPPAAPAIARQQDAPLPGARSARNANYDIDVRLDHDRRTLSATATIRWRNIGQRAVDEMFLHLYWNAWRNAASTWMRERALAAGGDMSLPASDRSSIEISTLALPQTDGSTGRDLLPGLSFVQPDDGNAEDRTLVRLALPEAIVPGKEVALRLSWTARVPRTVARTGVVGSDYFIAHWFPKVAVFEGEQWTAHQFHANTEFYSDYGRYDVRITVPRGWVVGATGVEQARQDNSDGTTTHRYVEEDVHDFAWTTSPNYLERRREFRHDALPPVAMRLLLHPEHAGQADRHFAATAATLRLYGEWFGPYPYPQLTIVDPGFQTGFDGMEYPTLFTAGSHWLAPRQSNTPEAVTVHEAGHQFWYGMVGNNEVEHAWLDEGLNTFAEARVLAADFRPDFHVERFFGGFVPWQFRDIRLDRATDGNGLPGYRSAAERDEPAAPSYRYWPGTHYHITYFKSALWLHTLERHLGWETLQQAMATFFARWRFRHPRPEDFFATLNEVSGQDLTWFFDQVYRSSNVFDYSVEALKNESGRTTVVVRRLGEAIFPVNVVTSFVNGEQVTERWDGRTRWRAFTYDRAVGAQQAVVDPERILLLDVDYTNNSRTLEPQGDEAATKWSLAWMVWLQDLLLTWSFFV